LPKQMIEAVDLGRSPCLVIGNPDGDRHVIRLMPIMVYAMELVVVLAHCRV
jgi:hypothetical protein